MSAWFGKSGQAGEWTTINNVASPLVYTETNNQTDFVMAGILDASINERESFGFNLRWDPLDRMSLSLDYHDSSAKRSPNSPFGSSAQVAISAYGRELTSVDYRNEIPVLTVGLEDPLSPDDLHISGSVFGNSWADMTIKQTQFLSLIHISEPTRPY